MKCGGWTTDRASIKKDINVNDRCNKFLVREIGRGRIVQHHRQWAWVTQVTVFCTWSRYVYVIRWNHKVLAGCKSREMWTTSAFVIPGQGLCNQQLFFIIYTLHVMPRCWIDWGMCHERYSDNWFKLWMKANSLISPRKSTKIKSEIKHEHIVSGFFEIVSIKCNLHHNQIPSKTWHLFAI